MKLAALSIVIAGTVGLVLFAMVALRRKAREKL